MDDEKTETEKLLERCEKITAGFNAACDYGHSSTRPSLILAELIRDVIKNQQRLEKLLEELKPPPPPKSSGKGLNL